MKITKQQLIKLIQEEMSLVKLGDTPQNNPIVSPNDPYSDHIDQEGESAKRQLQQILDYSSELLSMLNDNEQLESWIQSKLTKALDYVSTVKHHLEYETAPDGHEGCTCGGCSANESYE
tara:strand:+ start:1816 stop:2172 length:357 start_codon:yes stop_codon:yes gene_type:complete